MAKAILARQFVWKDFSLEFRGVACMDQRRRPCIAAICGHGRSSYVFGDLDLEMPFNFDALLKFPSYRVTASEGYVERRKRPVPMQKSILASLPPPGSTSKNVFFFRVKR